MTDVAVPDLLGGLARPEPPGEADLHPMLATASAQRVMERNTKYVDPQIPPRTRLLTGARLIAGNQGADRETYKQWQQDRTQPTPPRAGTDPRQGAILAAPDDLERGKALGGDEKAAAWLEATGSDPIDVARFDRANKVGRAAELWDRMKAGNVDDDEAFVLAEMVANTGQVLEDFDDGLTLGGGRVIDVGDRVRVRWDDEPAPGVVSALNLDTLPLDALDGDVDEGFEALIGDDIVIAAPVESQAKLRRAFPAASKGGTPRWLTVQPAVVSGLLRAVDSAGFDPSAHVSVHLSGHPALAPYDSLTFTTSDQKRTDRFRGLNAEHLGRGITASPRYQRRSVSYDDLVDPQTAEDMIGKTSWAIFDPNDKLALADRELIDVSAANSSLVMVFGISPDEAAEATSGFAYVNDGIAIESGYDGLEPYETDPAWFELSTRDGRPYRFSGSREEALLWPERSQRGVERWQIPLDERTNLNGLAAHLETLGAEDVAAYTTRPQAEGFSEAREVLWGDGTGAVASSRIAGLRSGPNVVPVWVRNLHGLPDDNAVDPDLLDAGEAEAAAENVNGRWRYDARGYPDLAETVRWGHTLGQKYGYDNVEIETDNGKLELVR